MVLQAHHHRCLEDFRTRRNQIRQCLAAWRDTRRAAAIASALVFVLASASASPRALHTARARANAERTGARRTCQWLHASATDASAIVRTSTNGSSFKMVKNLKTTNLKTTNPKNNHSSLLMSIIDETLSSITAKVSSRVSWSIASTRMTKIGSVFDFLAKSQAFC